MMSALQSIKSLDQEVIEKTGILQGDNRQKGVTIEENPGEKQTYKMEEKTSMTKSFVDVIQYIVNKTNFTRRSVIKFITQLDNPLLLQRQENVDRFVKIIEEQKKMQCHKNNEDITYLLTTETEPKDAEKLFFVEDIVAAKIGKTVFAADEANQKALCKYFPTDSDGEMAFAEHLERDPNVLMYAKIRKGSFIVENPVENYSPDWAIVYQSNDKKTKRYLIIETKWAKKWEDLSQKEQTKIICAKKHFEAIHDNIEYGVISGVEEASVQSDNYIYHWENYKKKLESQE